jgi:hypothetical protein
MLAMLVEPERRWRILTSQKYSTTWDGEFMLLDFNFDALDIPAREAFERANEQENPIGRFISLSYASHFEFGDGWAERQIAEAKVKSA